MADLRDDRQLVAAEIPLGPPSKSIQRLAGATVGIPIGLGLAMSHGVLLGIGGATFVAYAVTWTVISLARTRLFATENNLAIAALGRGELARARAVFVRWAPSRFPMVSGLARHNLGWTLMMEGRLEEAARILADTAHHYQRALLRLSMLPTTRLDTALCHALLGNLDLAATWCAMAEQPVQAAPLPSFPGMLALLRAVIACRTGRATEAAAALEQAWSEHEATMTGETLRLMRVLRAFAVAAADGPRSQGQVERLLGDLKPRFEREFAFLSGSWPEMAAFLTAHQLAG